MSGIDVLAVLDAAVSWCMSARGSDLGLTDARAAVAELIAADREYDAASDAWDDAPGCVQCIGDTDGRDYDGPEFQRLVQAIDRRKAALRRVQGGQP